MSYTSPAISTAGLTIPSYADVVAYLVDSFRSIFGSACYLGTDSADYQDIAVRGLLFSDALKTVESAFLALNPQTATGASLDRIGRLVGTARKSATYSTATVTLTGTPGATITGGVAKDVSGNYWNLASPAVIGAGGTVNVTATAQQIGNITANAGDISIIASPTSGWTSVANAIPAVAGQAIESDAVYRARLLLSQATPSISMVAGTAAAIEAVDGVTRSIVYENPTGSLDANNLPAHSITCIVEGGAPGDIAQAIYANKSIGCYTNGSTVVEVIDPSNPSITMQIRFSPLAYVYVYVAITVKALAGFTTAVQQAIADYIVAYLNSLGIGQSVIFSEIYGAALNARPNPDEPLFSIQAVSIGAQSANTTATLTSGQAAITVASATGISDGQVAVGIGIPAGATVQSISGNMVTLSANVTASGSEVSVSFFSLGTSDLSVAYDYAASGIAANVAITVV